jgi:hypothetical protein
MVDYLPSPSPNKKEGTVLEFLSRDLDNNFKISDFSYPKMQLQWKQDCQDPFNRE